MLNNMTRVQVIQVWFAAVALVAVVAMAFGAAVNVGTGGMLLALSIVPAVLIFLLWPQRPSRYGWRRAARHGSPSLNRISAC